MRIRRLYMPMTVTSSIVTDGNTDFQYYDSQLKAYLPDLSIIPYTFRLAATKVEDDVAQEVTSFIDTRVYEWVNNDWAEIQSTQGLQIDLTKAQITLSKNIPVGGERLFKIEAKIADSRQPNKPVPIAQQIRVSCRSLPNDLVSLFPEYPDGRNINVTKLQEFYRLRALYRQGQNALNNVWYRWYRVQNKIETEITDANAGYLQGYNSPILQIPPYGEFDGTKPVFYKVKTYPQEDLTGINQISKSMIYDGFNEFKAGLSVKGEDADGEYYEIRQDAIYNATNNGTDDVFHGRLNYKPNQRYILSLKYKVNSGNIFFIFTYSDGTKYQQLFSSTTLTTENFITPSGKSLSKISIGYGTGGTTYIYDIQLMEYDEGDSTTPEFRPAIADGLQPKPEFPDSALSTTFSLCKTYPKFNKEINVTSGGNLPVGIDMFSAECILQSNAGTLVDPQNYYSFQWRAKPVSTGLWQDYAKGSKILMPFTEEIDIDCNVIPGLDKARYCADFDGVDDRLSSAYDIDIDNLRIRTTFVPRNKSGYSTLFYLISGSNKLILANIKDSELRFQYGEDGKYYLTASSIPIKENEVYKVEIIEYNITSFTFKINGVQYTSSLSYVSTFDLSNIGVYLGTLKGGGSYFYGKILEFQVTQDSNTLLNFDFQPTDGDRANMLKNKNADGSVNTVNPITLTAQNIDNLNEIDPRYAFFKPV